MLKILHTADWHIGNFPCPSSGSRNQRFDDICGYIEYLIDKVQTMLPDIIIIAGDIFHQAKTWSDRGLHETNVIIKYIDTLSTIAPVCVLRGTPNHDGKTHFDLLSTALQFNRNVYIIDEMCVKNINNLAAIAFMPIIDKNKYRAENEDALSKEDENIFFTDKLRDSILELKKRADAYNLPSILVTHYTVVGSALPNGQTSIFSNQEIIIDPITLIQADFDLTCLGHIHKPQQLELCPFTFYSGSLCPLTFNDENDPHGFYMHIIKAKNVIESEFIEIPSRRFKTIYFTNDQLIAIMSNNYDLKSLNYIADNIQDYIVRIIYSCTDNVNKQLNKMQLEKALYKQYNVFYVQEIFPSSIAVTVDRTVMRNVSSVSDNLIKFLKNEQQQNKTITDAQINDCLQLAQPMIDELSASLAQTQSTGVFMPIEIEVKNYRNYANASFNFNNIEFCVINGGNGAGKSSLFMDAMLDALFETTRENDISGWINNNPDVHSGSIRFTFSIGTNIYKITRTRQKSGKATLNIAQLVTNEIGDEIWVDRSADKMKDTQAIINNVIGMDALTLKSCGLIMQDAYGLFLQADKSVRMDILGNILNLSIYNGLTDYVSTFGVMCKREHDQIESEENTILSILKNGQVINNNLTEANALAKQYETDLKKCTDDLNDCIKEHADAVKDMDRYVKITDELASLIDRKTHNQTAQKECEQIIKDADAVIAKESKLNKQYKRQAELVSLINDLTDKSKSLNQLMSENKQIEQNILNTENAALDANNKLSTIYEDIKNIEFELNTIESIADKASLYESTKAEIEILETKAAEISNYDKQLSEQKSKLQKLDHDFSNIKTEYNAKLAEIEKKLRLLTDSGCTIAETSQCHFLADARKARLDKPILLNELNQKESAYQQEKNLLLPVITELENKIALLKVDMPDINAKKQELKIYETAAFKTASVPEIKKKLAIRKQQARDFEIIKQETETKLKALQSASKLNTAKISALTQKTVKLDAYRRELDSLGDLKQISLDIAASKATKASAEKRIAEIKKELSKTNFAIIDKKREQSLSAVDKIKIDNINAKLLACRTQQALLNDNIANNNKRIGQFELELEQYRSSARRLDKLKQLKAKTSYTLSNIDWLKKAFRREGIPHNIIRSIIPVLETTASNILSQMSNNTMSIMLQTERQLTNKKEIATLDVIVCDSATGNLPYLSRSGGERVKAALSIVLALAEIKARESSTQLGFLFIDEPPFLDSNGVDAYCDALETIRMRYNNLKIMAITHDPELKAHFVQTIEVVKTPQGSVIYPNL